jgi:TATA-box binding protein (TBP) (component of TFIID and TFIIIB)
MASTKKKISKVSSNFDEIDISTQTIIGKTNWKINTQELFNTLPITEYKVIPKKRGRRPKEEKIVEPQILNEGEIITLKLGDKLRGVDLKKKKEKRDKDEKEKDKDKETPSFFRNSLTVVMFCEGKLINFKISKNGKFQFTGCKSDKSAHSCLDHIRKYIEITNERNEKKIGILPLNSNLEVIYTTVMTNINFSLGFCVNKENLDEYINKNTNYHSLLETTFGYTGVNIKINMPKLDNMPVIKMEYEKDEKNKWKKEVINYTQYLLTLDDKERIKEKTKVRYLTFLVFQSGNVILSSPHKSCMKETYENFMSMVNNCKSIIEEKFDE